MNGDGLRVEELDGFTALAQRANAWRGLAESDTREAGLFLSWEWLSSWLDAFQADRRLSTYLVWRGQELLGGLPLLEHASGFRLVRRLQAAANEQSPRTGLLAADGTSDAVLDALLSHLRQRDALLDLTLESVPADSRIHAALPGVARGQRLGVIRRASPGAPVLRLEGDWSSYLSSRDKHTQREWARKRRRLSGAGRVDITTTTSPDEVADAMAAVLEIEGNCWKHEQRTSFVREEGVERFYSRLARSCAERGWLRLILLRLDGRPIAHVLGVVFGGEFDALKTSYDQRFAALSPGVVVMLCALEMAFAERLAAFDLLGSPSRWKSEMTQEQRGRVDLRLFTRGLPSAELELFVGRMKPTIRRYLPGWAAGEEALPESRGRH